MQVSFLAAQSGRNHPKVVKWDMIHVNVIDGSTGIQLNPYHARRPVDNPYALIRRVDEESSVAVQSWWIHTTSVDRSITPIP